MSLFLKIVLVVISPILLISATTAVLLATPEDETIPVRKQISSNVTGLSALPTVVDGLLIVQDGGFEAGTPNASWVESVSSVGSPICNASCVSVTPTNHAHSGNYWAWMGGVANEPSSLTQTITIAPANFATLSFYLKIPVVSGSGGNDFFRVSIDGNVIFEVTDSAENAAKYASYLINEVNIGQYADGQPHQIRFYAQVTDGIDNFFLDDISVVTFDTVYTYLPTVLNKYCGSPSYSEAVRYDMSIINAPAMWAITGNCAPGENIVVAVIDTGVDLDHPDLQANMVGGASFISGAPTPDDDQGHGSHVAGSVAAAMNDIGVIGVAPAAKIMPVKVLSSSGSGSVAGVAAGIRWAADNGAHIINLSLGGPSFTSLEQDAVNYATAKGALVIAAAGNCGDPFSWPANNCLSLDSTSYPAAFTNAMAVASTTGSDQQSSFSTQGDYVEIAAPGSNIYSTVPGGGYSTYSGTSQATPHVAGLAAAIWSRNPALTNTQVRQILNNTAVDLGSSGWDIQFGNGRIDAYAAVLQSVGGTSLSSTSSAPFMLPETAVIDPDAPFVPGEVIVKLEDSVSAQAADVINALDLAGIASAEVTISQVAAIDAYILTVPLGEEGAYIDALNGLAGVEYAELNYIVTIQ